MRLFSTLLALALALGVSASSGAATRIDHEAECTYKTLSWSDFRGPVIRFQGVAWIASVVVLDPLKIQTEQVGDGFVARPRNAVVYALMNKLESGAQPGGRNDRTLAHEQLHFDITEYHARLLIKELDATEVSGSEGGPALANQLHAKVAKIYERTMRDLFTMQGRYDGETVHGTKSRQQKKWVIRVTELLAAEEPYDLR